MKLSEAIRAGAKRGPQLFGKTFDGLGGSCVVGAAWGTLTGKWTTGELFAERSSILAVTYPEFTMPATTPDGVHHWLLHGALIHMNDRLHMTREQIADWLEARGH